MFFTPKLISDMMKTGGEQPVMRYEFRFDERLGIKIPVLHHEWEAYSAQERMDILLTWEQIRSAIPDRIIYLENLINQRQTMLADEDNFERSCQLNWEIAELASIINDLNIWFRVQQDYETKTHY